jgi:hypothetical protein
MYLIDVKTAINLIGSTTTKQSLKIKFVNDETIYELTKNVSNIATLLSLTAINDICGIALEQLGVGAELTSD